ncbi:MAG TPA: hypothetical protein VH253_08115 [Phycisphaerae bacterium]|nr:hypothetical protein [Phycisphaerae bacterium]
MEQASPSPADAQGSDGRSRRAERAARAERWAARAAVLLFSALSLAPVWGLKYLPIQDYPQNLFQASLVCDALDGKSTGPFYEVHLHATYSAFFLLVWLFHFAISVWHAGKAAVSVYFLLTAAAAWRLLHAGERDGRPAWGALLLFPIAFNAVYFLGFFHFLYAMPLLLMALLDLRRAASTGWSVPRAALQLLYLLLLLMIHAFVLALYALIAAVWLLDARLRRQPRARFGLWPGLLLALGIVALGAAIDAGSAAAGLAHLNASDFASPSRSLEFLLTLFTGLNGPLHPDVPSLLAWLAIVAFFAAIAWTGRRAAPGSLLLPALWACAALTLATFAMPFRIGSASYLNVRIAAALYLMLAVAAAGLTVPRRAILPLLLLCLAAGAANFRTQLAISRETAAIDPVIAAVPPGAPLLPLLFDPASPHADPFFFTPHLHDHFYIHLEKGGASPYLLEGPREQRAPLSLIPGTLPPAPPDIYRPFDFRRELHAGFRYFLVRGGTPSLHRYMQTFARPLIASGPWTLYERTAAPSSDP